MKMIIPAALELNKMNHIKKFINAKVDVNIIVIILLTLILAGVFVYSIGRMLGKFV